MPPTTQTDSYCIQPTFHKYQVCKRYHPVLSMNPDVENGRQFKISFIETPYSKLLFLEHAPIIN